MKADSKTARTCLVSNVVRGVALAAPLLLLGVSQAEAASPCTGAHGSLDARLASLADRGVAPFVQFVHRTRMIYQIDVAEALDRVSTYRQNAAICRAAADK